MKNDSSFGNKLPDSPAPFLTKVNDNQAYVKKEEYRFGKRWVDGFTDEENEEFFILSDKIAQRQRELLGTMNIQAIGQILATEFPRYQELSRKYPSTHKFGSLEEIHRYLELGSQTDRIKDKEQI